jgi:hypothetical protein
MGIVGQGFWSIAGYRLLFNRYTLLLAAGVSSWATWTIVRTPSDPRAALRDTLLDSISERIAAQTPIQFAGRPIVVAQLGGDPDGTLTQGLRLRLGAEKVRSVSGEFLDRVLQQMGLQGKPVVTLDAAMRVARETGVEAVLFGDVVDQRLADRAGKLTLDLRWAETSTGRSIYSAPVSAEIGGPSDFLLARTARAAIWPRILIWLSVSLFLPIMGSPLIQWLTARESNALNLATLGGMTLIDTLIALGLMGLSASSVLPALALVAAFVCAAFYNYVAVDLIDQYRG